MAEKVLVAMSGGIDSSVAAALLIEQGFTVIGATVKMWPESPVGEDARQVAEGLGIPFYQFDLQEEFQREVIDLFVEEYKLGRTPNPCVFCNRAIKFGRLLEEARSLGIELVATGHYARIVKEGGRARLFRGRDRNRDQSYFLYSLTGDKLERILFPLGDLTKAEIRKLAIEFNLNIADKTDSQDLCFLSGGDYKEFLRSQGALPAKPGKIIDRAGNTVGCHTGVHNYTIGQRRGLGVAKGLPLYVVDTDAGTNTVVVGSGDDLFAKGFIATDFNWIAGTGPQHPFPALVAIRYNSPAVPATVTILDARNVEIKFHRPQRAIAPGQASVIYAGEEVLGGGQIHSRTVDEGEGCDC